MTNEFLALVGGTIYPSPNEVPLHDGVVLVNSGRIAAVGTRAAVDIPPSVPSLDCSGLTITAGFWNSHVHFFERKWAGAAEIPASDLGRQLQDMFTRYGFTSVFDTGSIWGNTRQIRNRIESGEVAGPRIRSTGEALIARNALPSETVVRMMGGMDVGAYEIENATQATAASTKLLNDGVDAIKVHLQPPPPPNPRFPESAIPAAVSEAHRLNKPVFLHPHTGQDVLAAARSGVDIIAHTTPHSGPWDEPIIAAMKEHDTALTPTLTIWKYYARHDRISAQDQIVNTELGQLRAWLAAGGTVLFGNDLGAVDYDPTEEYMLMAAAGMSFRQILAALTTSPAEQLAESRHLGRIATGLLADLVVLKADPSQDIRAFTAVQYTLRGGQIIYRTS